jgi:hexosaminidase
MAFPRLSGLSEVFWSPKGSRNWADFLARLTVHERRLDLLGINYRRAPDQ